MDVLIENYRGYDVLFNTDSESFKVIVADIDNHKTKQSFAAAKKYVDEYIKANNEFKPVQFVNFPKYSNGGGEIITVVGVRKDGRFMYKNPKGVTEQLPTYNEKDYILVNEKNDYLFEKIQSLSKEIGDLHKVISETKAQIIQVTIEDWKKNL